MFPPLIRRARFILLCHSVRGKMQFNKGKNKSKGGIMLASRLTHVGKGGGGGGCNLSVFDS